MVADALSLPMAEIAALLGEGKLKAHGLAEEAIATGLLGAGDSQCSCSLSTDRIG